jgi:hypothetical protein
MTLSPIVNTDVKIPTKMLEALTLHEMRCVVTGVEFVTQGSVKAFLLDRFGAKLANNFKPAFLFSSQAV